MSQRSYAPATFCSCCFGYKVGSEESRFTITRLEATRDKSKAEKEHILNSLKAEIALSLEGLEDKRAYLRHSDTLDSQLWYHVSTLVAPLCIISLHHAYFFYLKLFPGQSYLCTLDPKTCDVFQVSIHSTPIITLDAL